MTTAIIVVLVLVGFMLSLAVQVGEARVEEARASWLASPQGHAWAKRTQAEDVWRDTFKEVSRQTGDFIAACLAAEAAAQPCFKAARAAEEAANKG